MQARKILTGLMLCIAVAFPQYALAALYCSALPDGTIRVDDCIYSSYAECKRAIGNSGDCIVDVPPAAEEAPYCVVTWGTECKWHDYESCHEYAVKNIGFCYLRESETAQKPE